MSETKESMEKRRAIKTRVLIIVAPYGGNGDIMLALKLGIFLAKEKRCETALLVYDTSSKFLMNPYLESKEIQDHIKPLFPTLKIIPNDEETILKFDPEILFSIVMGSLKKFLTVLHHKNLKRAYYITEYNGGHYSSSEENDKSIPCLTIQTGFNLRGILRKSLKEIAEIPTIKNFVFPETSKIPFEIQSLIKEGNYFFGYATGSNRGCRKREYMLSVLKYLKKINSTSKNIVFIFPGKLHCGSEFYNLRCASRSAYKKLTIYSLSQASFNRDGDSTDTFMLPITQSETNQNDYFIHIITGTLLPQDFLRFLKGTKYRFVLVTGDQSRIEALELGLFTFYEQLSHKSSFQTEFVSFFENQKVLHELVSKSRYLDYSFNEKVNPTSDEASDIMMALENDTLLKEYRERISEILDNNNLFDYISNIIDPPFEPPTYHAPTLIFGFISTPKKPFFDSLFPYDNMIIDPI